MNKKAIAATAAFLSALFVCAACGKQSASPYGKVIVDKRGMEHVVMTDASGAAMVDNQGNYIEILTNSADKKPIAAKEGGTDEAYETAPITTPGVQQNGKTVEDAFVSVQLPKGWEQLGESGIVLRQASTGAQVTFYTNTNESFDQVLEEESSQRELLSGLDVQYSRETRKVDIYNATFERIVFGESVRYNYLIWTERGMSHRISCTVSADQEDKVDFDVVLSTVHFK